MRRAKIFAVAAALHLVGAGAAGAQSVGDAAAAGTGTAAGTAPAAGTKPASNAAPAVGTGLAAGSGGRIPAQGGSGTANTPKGADAPQ